MPKRLAGSLTCFVYIYFWHGAEFHLLLWSIFNFLGSAVELFAAWLERTKPVKKLEVSVCCLVVMLQCNLSLMSTSFSCIFIELGARCSSVVKAFAHGAMGRRIDPSCGGSIELFLVPASAP